MVNAKLRTVRVLNLRIFAGLQECAAVEESQSIDYAVALAGDIRRTRRMWGKW